MKGQKVKDAQWLLAGHNRFTSLATYKDGKIDGDYGPLTAQATKRAKFWLGYPQSGLDTHFGQSIYEYLRENDWRPLPEAYRKRREERLKATETAQNPGARAIEEAAKHIGYREEPRHGVNDNMFGRWYGWNFVPWCAIFESYCFAQTGTKKYHYASVEAIYWDAMANRNGLFIVRTPRKGDIVGYSLSGSRFAHTAFFDHWDGSQLVDLGGNTGPTNISNGGMVLRQERSTRSVYFYARVL
jgi:hypothetical protein